MLNKIIPFILLVVINYTSTSLVTGRNPGFDTQILDQVLSKLSGLKEESLDLKSRLSLKKAENANLTSQVLSLERQYRQTEGEWSSVINRGWSKHEEEFIGFLAIPTAAREYDPNMQVIFDAAMFNPGNAYNSGTSTFICPVNGYYWFGVTVLTDQPCGTCNYDKMFAEIEIDGVGMVRATAKNYYNNHQGHNAGIKFCSAGSQVAVYSTTTSTTDLMMIGSNEASFSGYLIWRT